MTSRSGWRIRFLCAGYDGGDNTGPDRGQTALEATEVFDVAFAHAVASQPVATVPRTATERTIQVEILDRIRYNWTRPRFRRGWWKGDAIQITINTLPSGTCPYRRILCHGDAVRRYGDPRRRGRRGAALRRVRIDQDGELRHQGGHGR